MIRRLQANVRVAAAQIEERGPGYSRSAASSYSRSRSERPRQQRRSQGPLNPVAEEGQGENEVANTPGKPRRVARHAARRAAYRRLLRQRRASGRLGTSRGSSRSSSCHSSSTTSPPLRVRVPWHVARLVAPLIVDCSALRRLVVDYSTSRRLLVDYSTSCRLVVYSASRRLIVDYFSSVERPGASAHRAARRRLLRLRRAFGCLGTSRGSSLVVDYFAYAARPGASARRAARHVARCAPRRRLLRLAQARRRLLRLRRASGCLGTTRGSSRGSLRRSSSTTFPTPCVRVPRHVARPVTRLIVDYSVCRDFVLQPRWLYFSHTVRRDYLSRGNIGSTSSTPRASTMSSSGCTASTIHLD
jgi:hypothetical protein